MIPLSAVEILSGLVEEMNRRYQLFKVGEGAEHPRLSPCHGQTVAYALDHSRRVC